MVIQRVRDELLSILKHKIKEEDTSEYILGKHTCSSTEIVYLFVVIAQKYRMDMNLLCDSLDDYLTIDKLARLIVENGDIKDD